MRMNCGVCSSSVSGWAARPSVCVGAKGRAVGSGGSGGGGGGGGGAHLCRRQTYRWHVVGAGQGTGQGAGEQVEESESAAAAHRDEELPALRERKR